MREQLSLFDEDTSTDATKVRHLNNLKHLNEVRRILASTPSYEEKLKMSRLLGSASHSSGLIAS